MSHSDHKNVDDPKNEDNHKDGDDPKTRMSQKIKMKIFFVA